MVSIKLDPSLLLIGNLTLKRAFSKQIKPKSGNASLWCPKKLLTVSSPWIIMQEGHLKFAASLIRFMV